MTADILPPIPNERALITALRKQWLRVAGTAAYRAGISVSISIVNGKGQRRVEVRPCAVGEFDEDA